MSVGNTKRATALQLGAVGILLGAVITAPALSAALAAEPSSVEKISETEARFVLPGGVTATMSLAGGSRTFDEVGVLNLGNSTAGMYSPQIDPDQTQSVRVDVPTSCRRGQTCNDGQIILSFSKPVTGLSVHIAEFGGGNGADGWKLASSIPAGAAMSPSSGNTFLDDGDGFLSGISTGCSTSTGGCGSLVIASDKPVTELRFDARTTGTMILGGAASMDTRSR